MPAQFNPDDINNAGREINNTYGTLHEIQAGVKSEVDPIIHGTAFMGPAGDSFRAAYFKYDKALEAVYDSLRRLGDAVKASGGSYDQSEDVNHREINMVDIPTGITSALA
jgi:WXG100 family type VII secretion target